MGGLLEKTKTKIIKAFGHVQCHKSLYFCILSNILFIPLYHISIFLFYTSILSTTFMGQHSKYSFEVKLDAVTKYLDGSCSTESIARSLGTNGPRVIEWAALSAIIFLEKGH